MEKDEAPKSYNVLARKYRPQNFKDLIGQEAMVQTLVNAFDTGRLAQAWMLTGIRGVGKTTTARILARALNYKDANIDKPTTHLDALGEHCQAIMEGRHLDVVEMDAASHTGIDDIREIIKQVSYKPVLARYKIYIIDEVHMLSTQAFNGLLKTLEEPPSHAKFIFATTEIHKVPITILSRCQRFDLRRIDIKTLKNHLEKITKLEGKEAEEEALTLLAHAAEGSVRDGLSLLDQAIAYNPIKIEANNVRTMLGRAHQYQILELFEYLMMGDIPKSLHLFQSLYQAGADPLSLLKNLAEINHIVTRAHFSPHFLEETVLSEREKEKCLSFVKTLSIATLSRTWQMLLKGLNEVQHSSQIVQATEMLFIRIAYAAHLPPIADLAKILSEQSAEEKKEASLIPPSSFDSSKAQNHSRAKAPNNAPFSVAIERGGTQNAGHHQGKVPYDQQNAFSEQETAKAKEKKAAPSPKDSANAKDGAKLSENGGPLKEEGASFKQMQKAEGAKPAMQRPAVDEQTPSYPLNSLENLLRFMEEKKALLLMQKTELYVRPIAFKEDAIIFESTGNMASNFPSALKNFLEEHTKRQWTVTVKESGGMPSYLEQQEQKHQQQLQEARESPAVKSFIEQFPGTKIEFIPDS